MLARGLSRGAGLRTVIESLTCELASLTHHFFRTLPASSGADLMFMFMCLTLVMCAVV